MKRISLSVVALILLTQAAPALAAFPDVPSTHPNYDAINYVQEKGIVSGYPDGTYGADRTINRAEFVKMLHYNASGVAPYPNPALRFTDYDPKAWYATFVSSAMASRWIEGYSDNTFRPGNPINFVEAAKILVKAFDISVNENSTVWYQPYVEYLADHKAIPLSITRFDQQITRGEMAEMVYRLKAKVMTKPSRTYDELVQLSNALNAQQWQTYTNDTKEWSITYPSTWTVGPKHYDATTIELSVPIPEGRKFVLGGFIDISTPTTCPVEEPGPNTVVQTRAPIHCNRTRGRFCSGNRAAWHRFCITTEPIFVSGSKEDD